MIALHDSDYLIYSCAWVAQPKDDDLQPLAFACHALDTALDPIIRQFDSVQYFLTGTNNWRHEIATIKGYKANRVQEKPVYYPDLREYMVDKYKAFVCEGEEADDAVGKRQAEDTCIVSIDKDLKQIAGWHYHPKKGEKYYIDEREATRSLYEQVLCGDRTDNVPGIDGVGPVTAKKMLAGVSSERGLWQTCRYQWNHFYPDGYPCDDGRRIDALQAATEVTQLLWISHPGQERWSVPS